MVGDNSIRELLEVMEKAQIPPAKVETRCDALQLTVWDLEMFGFSPKWEVGDFYYLAIFQDGIFGVRV